MLRGPDGAELRMPGEKLLPDELEDVLLPLELLEAEARAALSLKRRCDSWFARSLAASEARISAIIRWRLASSFAAFHWALAAPLAKASAVVATPMLNSLWYRMIALPNPYSLAQVDTATAKAPSPDEN
jgi:hypothetical protein